jgi:hypothetical protein
MERRNFLQMIGFTPLLRDALKLQSDKIREDYSYRGWEIKWSGWIQIYNQRILIGHWTAIKSNQHLGVYSSVPGACGWFLTGQIFDTSVYGDEGQMFITPEISEVAAENQKKMGLLRLIKFLDHPTPLPSYWRL